MTNQWLILRVKYAINFCKLQYVVRVAFRVLGASPLVICGISRVARAARRSTLVFDKTTWQTFPQLDFFHLELLIMFSADVKSWLKFDLPPAWSTRTCCQATTCFHTLRACVKSLHPSTAAIFRVGCYPVCSKVDCLAPFGVRRRNRTPSPCISTHFCFLCAKMRIVKLFYDESCHAMLIW